MKVRACFGRSLPPTGEEWKWAAGAGGSLSERSVSWEENAAHIMSLGMVYGI